MRNLVVAVTGASGAVYAVRLLEVLLDCGYTVQLTISPSGAQVVQHELGRSVDLNAFDANELLSDPAGPRDSATETDSKAHRRPGKLVYNHYQDFLSGIASGSFVTGGMVICPCSMGTLAAVAGGQSSNLIHRAADVHLKERRKLVIVPRETPVGSIQLGNMKRLSEAGAVILPAMPGFYHQPQSIDDLVNFVVGRICDQLDVEHSLSKRWGERDK